jgi:hypothetical protein
MRRLSLLVGAGLVLFTLPALAQEGTPTRIRGTIQRLDGRTLIVESCKGQEVSIVLSNDSRSAP